MMNKVLILGQARSGSTYFKNNLNRHNKCFFLNEPLAPGITEPVASWTRNGPLKNYCGVGSPKGMKFVSDAEWISCMKKRDENINSYFSELWNTVSKNTKGKCKNIGMKLFWNHSPTIRSRVYDQRNVVSLYKKHWWLDKNLSENIIPKFNKFIILKRPLEEMVFSRIKSMTTNKWGNNIKVREQIQITYPTLEQFMHGLNSWSIGENKSRERNKDFIINQTIRYHVGAESFYRYMEDKYDSLSVDYNNINWDEISNYLGMKIEDKIGYNKLEYNIERWLIENPEFKHICDRVKEVLN